MPGSLKSRKDRILAEGRWVLVLFFVCLPTLLGAEPAQGGPEVGIGIQGMSNPWKVAIAEGLLEKATGYDIHWISLDSGAQGLSGLKKGKIQIMVSGSSPIAAAIAQKFDIELFWILEDIAASEALVARSDSTIHSVADLQGKKVAVPFVSTSHFHLLFALEHFNVPAASVKIKNAKTGRILKAWQEGKIDAAFVWNPVLAQLKKTGRVIITSGELSQLGKSTFDGLIADRTWAADHPEFMVALVKMVSDADTHYRNAPQAWTPGSPQVQKIAAITGSSPEQIPGDLALYRFPSLEEQASARWLGGGRRGGAARALFHTSEFLRDLGIIPSLLPSYQMYINTEWVNRVRQAR